jgi:hypothetical protein
MAKAALILIGFFVLYLQLFRLLEGIQGFLHMFVMLLYTRHSLFLWFGLEIVHGVKHREFSCLFIIYQIEQLAEVGLEENQGVTR